MVQEEELKHVKTAFKTLLATAQLELVVEKTIRVARINNHDQALYRTEHLARTSGGYDDQTEALEALCDLFRDFARRDADRKERCLLAQHYMEWARDQATASQPRGPRGPLAMLYTKNLSLVGVVQPVEEGWRWRCGVRCQRRSRQDLRPSRALLR